MTTVELSPYLVLILVGFLPNEIWRALGLVLARGLNEDSEIVVGRARWQQPFLRRSSPSSSFFQAVRSTTFRLPYA